MAVTFGFSYKSGINYVDLFPSTTIEAIVDVGDMLEIETLNVTIPVTQDNTQTITISTTPEMLNAVFEVYPSGNYTTEQLASYNTISNISITENTLTVIRNGMMPTEEINIVIVFYE